VSEAKSELEIENATLRAQVDQLTQSLQRALREKGAVEDRLARLLRRYFGPKGEKIDPRQLQIAFEELMAIADEQVEPPPIEHAREAADDEEGVKPSKDEKRGRKGAHGRKPLPVDLPRERVVHEPAAAELSCASCHGAKTKIGESISEQLEYVPASFKVLEHVRPKYACKCCQEGVVIAALPPMPIEKGRPGPGLLAFVLTAKYCDHLPLYRLENIFARQGLEIARSTLCGWIASVYELLTPIFDELRRSVLSSRVLHGDDTPVLCLENSLGGGRKQGYLWVYVGDRDEVVYDFTLSRGRDGPNQFLREWKGKLQVDGHTSWEDLFARGDVVEAGCWAHARRYFFDAVASDTARATRMLALIQRMYAVEREAKGAEHDADKRGDLRREQTRPILAEIRALLDELAPQALPKSELGRAIGYANNQWDALVRFADDGELAIDNNSAERGMRDVAVGRKNWLFTGSPEGGKRAALLYSLINSCKLQKIDPFKYLRDVIDRVSTHPASRVAELTPRGWKASRAQTAR
jgi:transposase